MVKKAAVKDFFREIKKTASRFISITLLLMLAVGFFAGLRVTHPDMLLTVDKYMDGQSLFDLRVVSTLGLTQDDIDVLSGLNGVDGAVGGYSFDISASLPDEDIVVTVLSISDKMNVPVLLSGRMPEKPGECVAEEAFLSMMGYSLGDSFTVSDTAEGFEDALKTRSLTIVGTVRSPMYISKIQHGTTTLGSGSVRSYIMVPEDDIELDYYTDVYLMSSKAREVNTYSEEYDDIISGLKDSVEEIKSERQSNRYSQVVSEAVEQLTDAKIKLRDGESELEEAKRELEDGKTQLEDAKRELEDGRAQLEDAKNEVSQGWAQLNDSRAKADSEFAAAKKQLEDADKAIKDGYIEAAQKEHELSEAMYAAEKEIDNAYNEIAAMQEPLDAQWAQYNEGRSALDAAWESWNALPEEYKELHPEELEALNAQEAALEESLGELNDAQYQIDMAKAQVDAKRDEFLKTSAEYESQIEAAYAQLAEAERQASAGWEEYNAGYSAAYGEIDAAQSRLSSAEAEIAESETALADGENEIAENEKKIADGEKEVADGEKELSDAQKEIDDAQKKLDEVENCRWYIMDRDNSCSGFAGYEQDAERMGAIGNIFPIIFFAVAALVCLTTMTRMVDEKRIEIGTYKALGYNKMTTAGKFIGYSLFAAVIGSAGGIAIGTTVLPVIIVNAYSIMYDLPAVELPFYFGISAVSFAAALLCTVGATLAACIATLRETPARLLQPRAPEPGKRVLFERFTHIWKHMSFFGKVTTRNIFRYKKRFFMTIIGICGCTALIVTGFGLRDSIMDITHLQFGDIMKYDIQVYLNEDASRGEVTQLKDMLDGEANVSEYTFIQNSTADFSAASGGLQSGYIMVPEDPAELDSFIMLCDRHTREPIGLDGKGAVITEKLSEMLGVSVGDTLVIDRDGLHQVKISGITENYIYHYVYMTPEYYETVFGEKAESNMALITDSDSSEETANAVLEKLLQTKAVSYVSYFKTLSDAFEDSMNSVNSVVVIILVSAALLAFIVLYNLTNINITERTRELATIKVLGFYDGEVTWYIARENTVLTLIGTAIGLFGGKFMHNWLVRTVEIDIAMFGRTAKPLSYVLAAAMTIIFALIVNIIGHRKMQRINMVESLKTNE